MIRIAHLSDLHFGERFDLATWEVVEKNVVDFEPDLIVVSGDLVDHPSPVHLLSAKCALRDLSQRAREDSLRRSREHPRAAELVVIPGNHDVFEFGTSTLLKRLSWFEQIFSREDTKDAETMLEKELGCKPGFNFWRYGKSTRYRQTWLDRHSRAVRTNHFGMIPQAEAALDL
jgi:DNA repair exonuclease SbcCD nuclease subunit